MRRSWTPCLALALLCIADLAHAQNNQNAYQTTWSALDPADDWAAQVLRSIFPVSSGQALPGIGTAGGFGGTAKDKETFFSFTSFNRPTTIYRYDVASGEARELQAPKLAFDPDDYQVEQRFYASKDGTKVPMFIVRKKGSTGASPTLLYAYGGFNASMLPGYSPTRLAWLEAGGTYVLANIRGGGEYGKAWHDAGRARRWR